jgi:hypothetical protein
LKPEVDDNPDLSWSNASSRNQSIQENTYLNLRRQMQDLEESIITAESEGIKYDVGLNFVKKSKFDSYGYYADEERDLKENQDQINIDLDFEDQIQKKITNENFLQSGNAEEYLARNRLRKFQMYDSGLESEDNSEKLEESVDQSAKIKKPAELESVKNQNFSKSNKVTSPSSIDNRGTKLFKNEYITSIGRIELQSSRNEIHYSNFVNKVNDVKELSELFDKKQVKNESSMDNLHEIAINLQSKTQKKDLKNLSFKVFDLEKDFKNGTFNHFIDVTTDIEKESKEPSVKAEEQKNWSNVRAFGTGRNEVYSDNMDTNNTVNFLITNNSANNMRFNTSISTDIKDVPSRVSQTRNTSEFQTQSKVVLMSLIINRRDE